MSQSGQKPQIPMVKLWAALLLAILAILAIGDYERWVSSGFTGHTLWDWLTIFLLPLALVLFMMWMIIHLWPRLRQIQRKLAVQPKWRIFWITVIAALLVAFIILVVGGEAWGWTWTGFSDKDNNNLWAWLQLLFLPLVLTIAPLWFNLRLHQSQPRRQMSTGWRLFWLAQLALFLAAFVIVIIGGYDWGWTWTSFRGHKVWDWISLLALPTGLMFATIWFSKLQYQLQNQQQIPAPAIAANLVQQGSGQSKASSTIVTSPQPAPSAKSAKPAQQGRGSAPGWLLLLFAETILLIVGSFAFFLSFSALPSNASSTSCLSYESAIANGVMLGYNAQHTRVDPGEKIITPANVSRLKPAWKMPVPTGGKIGSAPTEANGIVYISANGHPNGDSNGIKNIGNFYAINATTGQVMWPLPTLEIGSYDFGNAPTVANGVVYLGAPDKYLYAYYAGTGKLKWKKPTGDRIGSSPTLANGVIYIGSDDGYLYAFKSFRWPTSSRKLL